MGARRALRLPLDDLLDMVGTSVRFVSGNRCFRHEVEPYVYEQEIPASSTFCEQTGVPKRTLFRWRADGGIPLERAEDVCAVLGWHPTEVWGDRYYEVALT